MLEGNCSESVKGGSKVLVNFSKDARKVGGILSALALDGKIVGSVTLKQ